MDPERENPSTVDLLAEDTVKGRLGALGLPARVARLSQARRLALQVEAYLREAGRVNEAFKLRHCADYLLFRHYWTVDEVRLHAASFCKKHLLCPVCAIRRGARMLKAYLERFEVVSGERPALRPYLVTLTVRNGDDLAERFRHLRGAMRALFQRRRDALKGSTVSEFGRSAGGFHSIEVTNKGKGWHPHVHMVWMCHEAPSGEALAAEWHAITGDSHVVDVRPISDPVTGFLEVCKYAVKFSDLALPDLLEAFDRLSGQRLIDSHGCFRGVVVPDTLTDDPLDDLPFVELLYRYLGAGGYSFDPQGWRHRSSL
jgi:hypothetical protein